MDIRSTIKNKLESDYEKNEIPIYISNKEKKTIMILSGGGTKGYAHIGALCALEDKQLLQYFNTFVGTSVGSIIISLYLVGYSPTEIWEFIKNYDLKKIKNFHIVNLFKSYGMDSGKKLEDLLKQLIKAKGYDENITLGELHNITKKRLLIATVCLNRQSCIYLSHETHFNLPLYLAVRMSSSIPLMYKPIIYENEFYIDGGCIDNYPINLFEDQLDNVLGIYLSNSKNKAKKINGTYQYISLVLGCLFEGSTKNIIRGYEKYTININIDSMVPVEFSMDLENKQLLYNSGYDAVVNFYKKD